VLLGLNLDYRGNRDAIVADALLSDGPMWALAAESPGKIVECQPNLVIAVSEDCYTQARLSLETRCDSYQVRTGNYSDDPISIYFTIRQYPVPGKVLSLTTSFADQCELAEDLTSRIVVPQVAQPIAAAIAAAG
jgi:hypothetical protein